MTRSGRQSASVAASVNAPFCGLADCVLACLGQSSEVFFDTQQDATCARLYARALLLDVYLAGFGHRADFHKRGPALLSEILEMCFSTLNKTTSFLWIG
jgi:hypothetical protein